MCGSALAHVAPLVECCPANQKVAGSIACQTHAWVAWFVPGQDTYERQQISVSLLRWCFFPLLSPPFPTL